MELAISRMARAYRKSGRCALLRQFPPISTDANNGVFYSSTAPIDFIGLHAAGRGLAVECKETAAQSLPLAALRDDQRAAMEALHAMGGDVRLVVDFTSIGEVYGVTWPAVLDFMSAPWRQSWSLSWFRAVGELLPVEVKLGSRRILFLDGKAHPGQAEAREQVERERAAAVRNAVAPAELADDAKPTQPAERLTMEQRLERVRDAAADGMRRQLDRPRRSFKRGRRAS